MPPTEIEETLMLVFVIAMLPLFVLLLRVVLDEYKAPIMPPK